MRCAIVIGVLAVLVSVAQAADSHADDSAYIRQAESDWAESVVTRDAGALERIVADDFVGISPNGSRYTKADEIKSYKSEPNSYVFNHLNHVDIRFYGDTAVAQGDEGWKKKDGSEGRYVWTDTWLRRNGKWQVIAAEDLIAPSVR
jgi:ketosteroid isomerase-like protein